MIYTLTLNPAVDYVVHIPELVSGTIMRGDCGAVYFGGKGINVSKVLSELDVKSVATGFLAGFTGRAIADDLKSCGIESDFVFLDSGFTRINVKIRTGSETDINACGQNVPRDSVRELISRLERLGDGDVVIMSGSAPKSDAGDIYELAADVVSRRGAKIVADTDGQELLRLVRYSPVLIKPNADELGQMLGCRISGLSDAVEGGRQALKMGARNVLVSLGGDGAVLLTERGEQIYEPAIKKAGRVDSVGAGDSMLAGFVAGYMKTKSPLSAMKFATAAGGAAAFCEGLPGKEEILGIICSMSD